MIIYLGSREGKNDTTVVKRLEAALQQKWRVLPLVDDLKRYADVTPEALHPINGHFGTMLRLWRNWCCANSA